MPVKIESGFRVPYVLRGIPQASFVSVLPFNGSPSPGDVVLTQVLKIGKNTRLELANGRMSGLYEGDQMACAFGHRYATLQFEGYADAEGDLCDMLSMAGVCGHVHTKASAVADPTHLRILGVIADEQGIPLSTRRFARPALSMSRPKTIVVVGSSMDSGKTYTAGSLVRGLRSAGHKAAAIKLTGTAAGRDTWSFADSGAEPALDFVDAGWPSTYLCSLEELLRARDVLVSHAAAAGAEWVVIEVADGLLQRETTSLLESAEFKAGVDHWLFATGDSLAALAGVRMLRNWGIEPIAISGMISTRPLAMIEAENATQVPVLTAKQIETGYLEPVLSRTPDWSTDAARLGRVAS